MRTIIAFITLLLLSNNISFSQIADSKCIEWFQNAKFGLFLHWGLYSQTAGLWKGHPSKGGEHFMLYERIPLKEYAKIAQDFNPTEYNAAEWVKAAKYAGMKYIIITSKHHDGFSMYDSKVSDYNIVKCTPYGKDPMIDLIKECRKEGLKFGFYYSLGRDWENPNVPTNWPTKGGRSNTWDYPDEDAKCLSLYIEEKVKPQLKELLTNYGKIDFIWFDTPELVTKEQSAEIRKLIYSLQPQCLVNQRIGNKMGDYEITEQKLSNKINTKPWEACITMGKNWGYNRFDTVYKAPDMIIRHLCDIVSKGGNLLLNVGPTGKGTFPNLTKPGFEMLHNWLKKNGEAIYGTRPWRVYGEDFDPNTKKEKLNEVFHDAVYDGTPQERVPDFRFTTKDNAIYVIVRHVNEKEFILKSFSNKKDSIKSISCLGDNIEIKWNLKDNGLNISIEELPKNKPIYVLKIIKG